MSSFFSRYLTCKGCEKKCSKATDQVFDGKKKPFGDYFCCDCSDWRPKKEKCGYPVEVEYWYDALCSRCAREQQKCRICCKDLPKSET